jgi:hypothetical protein
MAKANIEKIIKELSKSDVVDQVKILAALKLHVEQSLDQLKNELEELRNKLA